MPLLLSATEFLASHWPLLDVRSPSEFQKAHVPSSLSMPLFEDLERQELGTLYKQESKEQAVLRGLELVGPRLRALVETAARLAPARQVRLYCWRGGMRSQSVAWLLEQAGFEVLLLEGGYKSFRRWVLSCFEQEYHLWILGGLTGVGKSDILPLLREEGAQTLDLEGLANHRGSAFGGIGQAEQPSTQQYENELACQLSSLKREVPIWIEDESRLVGRCAVPEALFRQMSKASLVVLNRSLEERVERLCLIYGSEKKEELAAAGGKIRKRLGSERARRAVELIFEGDLPQATEIFLRYYDKRYQHSIDQREISLHIDAVGLSDQDVAAQLIEWSSLEQ
jgi:tRNA 2-selenouridine synthase